MKDKKTTGVLIKYITRANDRLRSYLMWTKLCLTLRYVLLVVHVVFVGIFKSIFWHVTWFPSWSVGCLPILISFYFWKKMSWTFLCFSISAIDWVAISINSEEFLDGKLWVWHSIFFSCNILVVLSIFFASDVVYWPFNAILVYPTIPSRSTFTNKMEKSKSEARKIGQEDVWTFRRSLTPLLRVDALTFPIGGTIFSVSRLVRYTLYYE